MKKSFSIILMLMIPASAFAVDPCENVKTLNLLISQREIASDVFNKTLPEGPSKFKIGEETELKGLRAELEAAKMACAAKLTPEQQIAKDKSDIEELKKEDRAAEVVYQKSIKNNEPMDKLGPKYNKTVDLEKKITEIQKELDQLTQTKKTSGKVGPIVPGETPPGASVDDLDVETSPSKPVQNTHAPRLPEDFGADRI